VSRGLFGGRLGGASGGRLGGSGGGGGGSRGLGGPGLGPGGSRFDRHLRIVRAILSKDLTDALRDSRVVIPLLIPIGLGLLYSFMFGDEPPRPTVTVAYVTQDETQLPAEVKELLGDSVTLKRRSAADAAALRRLVADGDADLGVVVPAGFDGDARAGRSPRLELLVSGETGSNGQLAASFVERAAVNLAGRPPTVTVVSTTVAPAEQSALAIFDELGLRKYEVLLMTVLLLVMVGTSVVPTVLADETQTRTLDALLMVASYGDVIVAKALFGFIYSLIGVPILLAITRIAPADVAMFAAVTVLTVIVLVGLGPWLGSYVKTSGQLSVWSNVAFFPLLGAMIAATLDLPAAAEAVLAVIPTTHTTRLAANAFAGVPLFSAQWLSWLVLCLWAVVVYFGLWWRLRRMDT
jgi:ABC-2 type transport system permease protein